jgi:hypothetical protein
VFASPDALAARASRLRALIAEASAVPPSNCSPSRPRCAGASGVIHRAWLLDVDPVELINTDGLPAAAARLQALP